jgi:hypothetical protein
LCGGCDAVVVVVVVVGNIDVDVLAVPCDINSNKIAEVRLKAWDIDDTPNS